MKILNNNDFLEELEKLPSEQLDKMMRRELESSHSDEDLILHILSILEKRDSSQPREYTPEVMAAWARFQAAYAAPAEDIPTHPKRVLKRNRWLGGLAAAAAILCLVIFATPKVSGAPNIFEVIGQWTQELFSFFSAGQPDEYTFTSDNPDLQKIYEAVSQQGVTRPVVPTWIPEGFEMVEFKEMPSPMGNKIYARLISGEDSIVISYEFHDEAVTNKYAKDDTNVEKFEYGSVEYYLISNAEQWTVAWAVDNLECVITANLEEGALRQIIRSIS